MIGNSKTRLEQWDQIVVSAVAVIWCLFQIVTGLMPMEIIFQRAIHITFALVLVFLMFSFAGKKQDRISLHGWVLAAIVVMISVYVLNTWEGRAEQIGQAPPIHEIIMGVALIVLSLDAARRTTGWALPIFTIAIIFYSLFGENLPWIFAHRKYDLERIVTSLFLTYDGIYGGLTGISATFLFLFMVFGTFLRISGAGEFFIDLASSLFGHVRGGSAKISIVASSLFGMITGSVVANVSAIGQITIPMMKKGGYRPEFAGAVEACSGLGSQIMPPVMGGSVFIMVELLQTPYFSICKAAFITACLFYLCIFMMVDLEAVKYNLKGVPKEQRKEFWKVFKGGYHFFIPIGVLVYLLGVVHYSESRAVFWAIIAVPICSYFRESSRMGIDKIYMALKEGAQICLTIVPIIINCSIISALIVLTGLGLNISDMLIQLAGGSLIGLLILTSIASLIIGTGMPIIVSYILLAILVCPALVKMGVYPMAAHLFVFFFALLADLTPPVAVGSFVAAGIAGARPMTTSWIACRLGLILYFLPFMMIYNPTLLLINVQSIWDVVLAVITASIGVIAISGFIQGQLFGRANVFQRILLLVAGLTLIWPAWKTDLIGATIFFGVILYQRHSVIQGLFKRKVSMPGF